MAANTGHFRFGDGRRPIFAEFEFGLYLTGKFFCTQSFDQDFDAGFVHVVAAAMAVVHTQNGFAIAHHVLPRQKFTNH